MGARGATQQPPFADRLAALVAERRSQVCLGLDPDPSRLRGEVEAVSGDPGETVAGAVVRECGGLIDAAGPACVAVKLQLACFERLGPSGWEALFRVADRARAAGLLVIADGKRGDVPHTAAAYGQALFTTTPSPWGEVAGLCADAATVNALLGGDALDALVDVAAGAGAGLFVIVRSSNPGAADLLDLDVGGVPLFEHLAGLVASRADRLAGQSGLSGMGAVVGATEPRHLGRLRELMPEAILLLPGVGAQGGEPAALGAAFGGRPAGAMVAASRSIATASDPAAAAEELRAAVWSAASR